MSKDKKLSADDLSKTGKDSPVELQESDLDQAVGGIANIANKLDKNVFPKVEINEIGAKPSSNYENLKL